MLGEAMMSGIIMGSLFGAMAVGLTIIYGVIKMFNFAHGIIAILGAYLAWWLFSSVHLNLIGSIALSFFLMFLIGILIFISIIRVLLRTPRWPYSTIIASIGLGIFLENLLLQIFGPRIKSMPAFFESNIKVGGIMIGWHEISLILKEAGVPEAQAVVIGPAGENLVKFAFIKNNYWRSLGRCGMGAVMGSKKLKAIVFHGKKQRKFFDENLLKNYIKDLRAKGKDNPGVAAYRRLGTTQMVAINNKAGAFPTKYWSRGHRDDWERISGETFIKELKVKPTACTGCFVACGKLSQVLKGRHKGLTIEGPEYETIYVFGGLCLIETLEEIAYLNDICDRLGIDTMTTGDLIAFIMEASQRGALNTKLNYGDVDGTVSLIKDIAERKGLGAILSQGIKQASRELNLEDLAIHVKGLEPAGYEPRTLKGMSLAYGTSDRGVCHLRATVYKAELSGMIAPDTIEGKAKIFVDFEDRHTLFDTLILCRFYRDLIGWDELSIVYKATTGLKLNKEDLKKICCNIMDTTRKFNIREGLTKKDDFPPTRFFTEPIENGRVVKEEDYEKMLSDYYRLRGWDEEGRPKGK